MDDFYIEESGLASYFEAQWLDKFREEHPDIRLKSASKYVPDSFVFSPFFQTVSEFIADACRDQKINPK